MTTLTPALADTLALSHAIEDNHRLRKLLGLMLLRITAYEEARAFRVTREQMREPINAELCIRDEHGITSVWIEPRRSTDLTYTPPQVKP